MKKIKDLERKTDKRVDKLVADLAKNLDGVYGKEIKAFFDNLPATYFNLLKGVDEIKLENYPALSRRVDALIRTLADGTNVLIGASMSQVWGVSNNKLDGFLELLMPADKVTPQMLARNVEALKTFISRTENGLTISDRVWKNTRIIRNEIEATLELGIFEGKSADAMAKDLLKYTKNPTLLDIKMVELKGTFRKSQYDLRVKPGRGVYRSSYQNALRLTQTETNMSYRVADRTRIQNLDFVVGIEIVLSARHPVYDICDPAAGMYPKDFVWRGWHPRCICHQRTVLMTQEELDDYIETGNVESKNTVTKPPKSFENYIKENSERYAKYKNKPYWAKDNNINFD